MARWDLTPARKLLPRAVAFLGELSLIVGVSGSQAWAIPPKHGRILCADASGRWMYIITPLRTTERPDGRGHFNAQTFHAAGLYERFTNRAADRFYNCTVRSFRQPRHCGEILEIRYLADKNFLDPFALMGEEETEHDDPYYAEEEEDDGEEYIVEGEEEEDDDDELETDLVEFVHYFEQPGVRPAYAELWSVGKEQWVIPPGPWKITARGIEYAPAPRRIEWPS